MSGQMPISTETYRSGSGGGRSGRKRVQMLGLYLMGVAIGLLVLGMMQQGRRNAAIQAQMAAERQRAEVAQQAAEAQKKAAETAANSKQPTP